MLAARWLRISIDDAVFFRTGTLVKRLSDSYSKSVEFPSKNPSFVSKSFGISFMKIQAQKKLFHHKNWEKWYWHLRKSSRVQVAPPWWNQLNRSIGDGQKVITIWTGWCENLGEMGINIWRVGKCSMRKVGREVSQWVQFVQSGKVHAVSVLWET